VIQTSLNQLNWGKNPDDLKLIFIAGNEPFTQGKIDYKDATANANEKDVTVNTIFCGDYRQGVASHWKDGAQLTQGDYMAINQNRATVHIASPYDDEILNLNKKLNATYIIYGSKGREKKALQIEQDVNASGYSKANAVKRTVSSKAREAIQNKIKALHAKRKAFVLEQKKEQANGLENAMTKAIKEQAKRKKYSWN